MSQQVSTSFPADVVPQAAEDPLFGLMTAYRADTSAKKVDLGIGAYRDENAKPWVLPVVKKVTWLSFNIIQMLTTIVRLKRDSKTIPTSTMNIFRLSDSPSSQVLLGSLFLEAIAQPW